MQSSPSALTFARLLGEGPLARVALEAALAQIAEPAFIASSSGTVLHANPAGAKKVDRSRDRMRSALARAIGSLAEPETGETALVTALRSPDRPDYFLVIFRAPTSTSERVAYAATLWELTPKQKEVLELLAGGFSNKVIATRLDCTERTVETHLTAIFRKSGFDGRTALLAAMARREV